METLTAKLLRIRGRVQGVGYRESMRREAARLGIRGWVRNRQDGTVEALVYGAPPQVAEIVAWARQGPRFAAVNSVDVSEAVPTGLAPTFEIRPSS